MAAWRYEISLPVLKKYFTRSLRSLVNDDTTQILDICNISQLLKNLNPRQFFIADQQC